MKEWSHLNSAVTVLNQYKGNEPFAGFLKKYFSQEKKFGSRDRKQIAHICYCFFRLGKLAMELPVDDRALLGVLLCSEGASLLVEKLRPEWKSPESNDANQKLNAVYPGLELTDVFPWKNELTKAIDAESYIASFFIQPDMYLRLRPGREDEVYDKLEKANIEFSECGEDCLQLPPATSLDGIIDINQEVVIQDYNSQRIAEMFSLLPAISLEVWDCCAASGGKSMLIADKRPVKKLWVSDVRESIMTNLKKRFADAGIRNFHSFVTDVTKKTEIEFPTPDLIIADVPCSGSGTWSRTPEQLYFFKEEKIIHYQELQRRIVAAVIPQLFPGSYFLYITCSVFSKENEDNVQFIQDEFGLTLVKAETFIGYDRKADTLFAALFKK